MPKYDKAIVSARYGILRDYDSHAKIYEGRREYESQSICYCILKYIPPSSSKWTSYDGRYYTDWHFVEDDHMTCSQTIDECTINLMLDEDTRDDCFNSLIIHESIEVLKTHYLCKDLYD